MTDQREIKIVNNMETATVLDGDKKCEANEKRLKCQSSKDEVRDMEQQTLFLRDQCVSIRVGISKLLVQINEEEEKTLTARAKFNICQNKMEDHRKAVLHAVSQTDTYKELEEKREVVRMLKKAKEELEEDLRNPTGCTIQMAKGETDALKEEIAVIKKMVAENRKQLQKEFEKHIQLKKDIEIQNRRYEAIVKRLRCQLSKAQAAHRQISSDIYHLEMQIAELKQQLDT